MNDLLPFIIIGVISGTALGYGIRGLIALYRKLRPPAHKENDRARPRNITSESPILPKLPARWRGSAAALVIMTLLLMIWGLLAGFVAGAFSHLFYLGFILALALGFSGGKAMMDAGEQIKFRTVSQVVLVSVLAVVATYGMFHYTRYLGFIVDISFKMFGGFSEAIEGENLGLAKVFADYALKEETGFSGFAGHVLYEAQEGITLKRPLRITGLHLGTILTWLYWLVEFGIILGLTIQMGSMVISKPVCESCGSPCGSEKHLGSTASANESRVLALIRQKDFAGLGKLMEPDSGLPSLEVYFRGCEVCGGSGSRLLVRHAFQGEKGMLQFKDATQTALQPAESISLLKQLRFSGD